MFETITLSDVVDDLSEISRFSAYLLIFLIRKIIIDNYYIKAYRDHLSHENTLN